MNDRALKHHPGMRKRVIIGSSVAVFLLGQLPWAVLHAESQAMFWSAIGFTLMAVLFIGVSCLVLWMIVTLVLCIYNWMRWGAWASGVRTDWELAQRKHEAAQRRSLEERRERATLSVVQTDDGALSPAEDGTVGYPERPSTTWEGFPN